MRNSYQIGSYFCRAEAAFIAPLPMLVPNYAMNGVISALFLFQIIHASLQHKETFSEARRRWEDNSRMGLEEMGINAGNWVD